MKKYIKSIVPAALLVCLIISFAGCASELSPADIGSAYKKAVENTMKADNYYWKESVVNGKNVTSRNVNVIADFDVNGNFYKEENGDYKNFKIYVYDGFNSSKKNESADYWCGPDGKGENYLLKKAYYADKTTGKSEEKYFKEKIGAKELYNSEFFKEYLLSSKLDELTELTADDMDFTEKKSTAEENGNVVSLVFKVKDEYLKQYENTHGKASLFAGSSRVSIEIAYERISHVIIYAKEEFEGKYTVENETYKFEVVYTGPKIDIPNHEEKIGTEFKWQMSSILG